MTGDGEKINIEIGIINCSKFSFPKLYSTKVLIFPTFPLHLSMESAILDSIEEVMCIIGVFGQEQHPFSPIKHQLDSSILSLVHNLYQSGKLFCKESLRRLIIATQLWLSTNVITADSQLSKSTWKSIWNLHWILKCRHIKVVFFKPTLLR
jgi:hypothetical protein